MRLLNGFTNWNSHPIDLAPEADYYLGSKDAARLGRWRRFVHAAR